MAVSRNDVFQPLLGDADGAARIMAARARDPRWNTQGAKAYADPYKLTGHGMTQTDAINAGYVPTPWVPSSGIEMGARIGSAAGATNSKGTPTSARGRFQRLRRNGADEKVTTDAEAAGRAAARKAAGLPVAAPAAPVATTPTVPVAKPAIVTPPTLTPSLLPSRQRGFDDQLKKVRRIPSSLSRLYDMGMSGESQRASQVYA